MAGGEDVWSLTGKLTWLPGALSLGRGWILRPFTLGLQVTYTFGEEFFVTLPGGYPDDYYDVPTALRAGLAVGGTLGRRNGGRLREVSLYWELVALDAMVVAWARNPGALGPAEVFSLALGLRVGL